MSPWWSLRAPVDRRRRRGPNKPPQYLTHERAHLNTIATFDREWIHKLPKYSSELHYIMSCLTRGNVDIQGDSHSQYVDSLVDFGESLGFDMILNDTTIRGYGICYQRQHIVTGHLVPGTIKIAPGPDNHTVRTLVHELTHGLGAVRDTDDTDEVTAESTSFLVCRELNLDTTEFAFPYVAGYLQTGGRLKLNEIEGYANAILEAL